MHFRKRLNRELIGQINETIVKQSGEHRPPKQETTAAAADSMGEGNDDDEPPSAANAGQLMVDASCTPADIRYPTDLSLLNQAREHTEHIIDRLYEQVRESTVPKPRTYRHKARQPYLHIAKQRQVNRQARRKAIGQQLRYLRRNLSHIDHLIAAGASFAQLDPQLYRKLLVSSELVRQQQWM